MRLVIITNEYPFGKQEAFLEEEIKVLEHYFSEIHIYTYAEQETERTRYVPQDAKVIRVMNQGVKAIVFGWITLFSSTCIKEVLFTRKAFSYRNLRRTIPILAKYYNYSGILLPTALRNETTENTIFYSYWLSHQAYGLSKFKRKNKEAFCISRAHRVDNFIEQGVSYYRRELLETLNSIYPISNMGVRELVEKVSRYSKKACPIKKMQLGVNVPNVIYEYNKDNDTLILCSCSFIWSIKRLDIIIDSLSEINDINIVWNHFGGGELEKEIREMADLKLSSKKNIVYKFCGQTEHDQILSFYKTNRVDLFVNASDSEGIPVSIMEAMAHGIPCVARNVGGNCEIINQDNGYLLDENAGALEYAEVFRKHHKKSIQAMESMRANAYEYIQKEYNADEVYKNFAEEIINRYHDNLEKTNV